MTLGVRANLKTINVAIISGDSLPDVFLREVVWGDSPVNEIL